MGWAMSSVSAGTMASVAEALGVRAAAGRLSAVCSGVAGKLFASVSETAVGASLRVVGHLVTVGS